MAQNQLTIQQDLKNKLEAHLYKAQTDFAAVLPKALTPERFIKCALVAATKTPKLLEAYRDSPATFLQAVMTSAELGLEVGNTLGLFYLLPFKNNRTNKVEVQGIVGYKGYINLALRNPRIKSIRARPVYSNEEFSIEYGLHEEIRHKPQLTGDPGEFIGVYAVAELDDGATVLEWMPKAEVDGIRRRSKAANNGPWVTDFVQMARKTVIRRICNYLPLANDLARALELDEDAAEGPREVDPNDQGGKSRTDALAERLAGAGIGGSEIEDAEFTEEEDEFGDARDGEEEMEESPPPPTEPPPDPKDKGRSRKAAPPEEETIPVPEDDPVIQAMYHVLGVPGEKMLAEYGDPGKWTDTFRAMMLKFCDRVATGEAIEDVFSDATRKKLGLSAAA